MVARILIVCALVSFILAALLGLGTVSGGPGPVPLIALGLAFSEGARLA